MSDLHQRLLAAIEAEMIIAVAATTGPWTTFDDGLVWADAPGDPVAGCADLTNAAHIAAQDPATTLRRLAEDRDVLARHPVCVDWENCGGAGSDCHGCRGEFHPCPEILSVARRHGLDLAAPS